MKQLLLNRKYHVDGTWYEPAKFLENKFKSVVRTEYTETSSSAGDWTGYLVQKLHGRWYVILFWQTNSYPASGFDIETDSMEYFSFDRDAIEGDVPTKDELDEMMWLD